MTGSIRITSGRLRGRKVRTPPGEATRPLLTRIRKSLADILRPRLTGSRVLDLFGGSGAIAFELLSNGASQALLVELDPRAADLIRANASLLGAPAEVVVGDALEAVRRLASTGTRFQVIVVAPPYGRGLQQKTVEALERHPLLAPTGVLVVQRDAREPAPLLSPAGGLRLEDTRRYGRTILEFYEATTLPPDLQSYPPAADE